MDQQSNDSVLEHPRSSEQKKSMPDIDSFLPLKTIADLGEIKALTGDQEIVKKALQFTTNIVVDDHREMLKPTFKVSQRNTIVLRDIPADATTEEIHGLFKDKPTILEFLEEMKGEVGSTYFMRFRDEQSALQALGYAKTQTFREKPVSGFVKAENLNRSFFYLDAPVEPLSPGINPYVVSANYTRPYNNRRNNYNNNYNNNNNSSNNNNNFNNNNTNNFNNNNNNNFNNNNNYNNNNYRERDNSGHHNNNYHNNSNYRRGGHDNQQPNSFGANGPTSKSNKATISPVSTASYWPPLAPSSDVADIPSGYQGDYKKYTKEQIVAVLSNIKDNLVKEPPVWEKKVTEVMVEGDPLLYSEILKAVPKDAKVEFIDTRHGSHNHQTVPSAANAKAAPVRDYKNKALRGAQHEPAAPSQPKRWRNDGESASVNNNSGATTTPPAENGNATTTNNNNNSNSSNFISQNRSGSRNRNNKNKPPRNNGNSSNGSI